MRSQLTEILFDQDGVCKLCRTAHDNRSCPVIYEWMRSEYVKRFFNSLGAKTHVEYRKHFKDFLAFAGNADGEVWRRTHSVEGEAQ